jgi:GNAT superfamily N-acetyltransferase
MISLVFQAPKHADWPVCRMLLPEIAPHARRHEYRLAIDRSSGAIAGAAAFVDNGTILHALQLHTVLNRRAQGIGAQLLDHVLAEAALRHRKQVTATVRPSRDPALHDFLRHRGFEIRRQFLIAEGDLPETYRRQFARSRHLAELRASAGGDWQILPLSVAMLRKAGQLYAENLSGLEPVESGGYYVSQQVAGIGLSQVLVVNGGIQGVILLTRNDNVVTVQARIVRPPFRRSRGSAALVLRALEAAVESGAKRFRFCYFTSTLDTSAFARRMDIPVIETLDELANTVG